MFILEETKKNAETALANANGANVVQFDKFVLVKSETKEQKDVSGEKVPLGSFTTEGGESYILYNA